MPICSATPPQLYWTRPYFAAVLPYGCVGVAVVIVVLSAKVAVSVTNSES